VLKITDNATVSDDRARPCTTPERWPLRVVTQCLKFKTSSSVFLNRFEALNLSLVEKMQNRQVKVETPEAPALIPPPQISVVATASGSVLTPQSTAAASGGVKKKKPKKKK
jgi:signal recognition particle subunit SRP9